MLAAILHYRLFASPAVLSRAARQTDLYQDAWLCLFAEPQAIKILNMIKVFGKPIRVNKAASDKRTLEVGANLFVGNLDTDVDEKVSF